MLTVAEAPQWVKTLATQYAAGSSSFFVLHGNVDDGIGHTEKGEYRLQTLTDYIGHRLLGNYDIVLHYDVGRGLRIHPAGDQGRESRMKTLLGNMWPGLQRLPQEPTPMLRLMDRLVTRISDDAVVGIDRKTAFIFDYAEMICPAQGQEHEHVATMLNWARNPKLRQMNLIFILMAASLARLNPALIQSGFTSEIQIPMPVEAQREALIRHQYPHWQTQASQLAGLSAGLTLMNLDSLLRLADCRREQDETTAEVELSVERKLRPAGATQGRGHSQQPQLSDKKAAPKIDPETWSFITAAKKGLIEAQCPELLEFIEPKFNLDLVAGHATAKQRLAEDALLIKDGNLAAVPMGYLLCGPVGVGKTFLALCYAGSMGIPCVMLKNFRSMYVGETEANLEKILQVLRELGPVAVIIDEADAAVGNRASGGDSGTSSRVFAQLAAQMGDTRYRGRTIWFLLTCRPDLLPVDLKRQGRCEEHIPLFYPETEEDRVSMFLAMGKKIGLDLNADHVPALESDQELSGADIESLLTRVQRETLVHEKPLDKTLIADVLKHFRSPRSSEHELQVLAAIMECSDRRYLTSAIIKKIEDPNGWDKLKLRFNELKLRLDRF